MMSRIVFGRNQCDDEQALTLADSVIAWYKKTAKPKRLGRLIDEIGVEKFMRELRLPPM